MPPKRGFSKSLSSKSLSSNPVLAKAPKGPAAPVASSGVASAQVASAESGSFDPYSTIEDLLQKQFHVIKEALAFNTDIAKRLQVRQPHIDALRYDAALLEPYTLDTTTSQALLETVVREGTSHADEIPGTAVKVDSFAAPTSPTADVPEGPTPADEVLGSAIKSDSFAPPDLAIPPRIVVAPENAVLTSEISRLDVDKNSLAAPLLASGTSTDDPPMSRTSTGGSRPRTSTGGSPPKKGIARAKSILMKSKSTEEEVKRLVNSDPEDIVQESYVKEDINDEGFFSNVARHPVFSNSMFIVITVYTLWIAVETDYNRYDCLAQAPLAVQIIDNIFCWSFTLELVVRFLALRRKCSILCEFEFMFDFLLVASMIWETWISVAIYRMKGQASAVNVKGFTVLRVFRLFRLARIGRSGKLVRAVPEIMIFIKGIFAAMRSVGTIIFALTLIIYVFGIIFVQLLSDQPVAKDRFETVPMAMNFLMLQVVCGLDSGPMLELLQTGWLYYILYLLFVFITPLTTMNMLVGTVVNVVQAVGEGERDILKSDILNDRINVLTAKFTWDHSGEMTKQIFDHELMNPIILKELGNAEIDVTLLIDFLRTMIPDDGKVSRETFEGTLHKFMNFRTTSVKDIMQTQQRHTLELANVEENIVRHFYSATEAQAILDSSPLEADAQAIKP